MAINKDKIKYPSKANTIDHMKSTLFLNNIMKDSNESLRSEFFNLIDEKNTFKPGSKVVDKGLFLLEVMSKIESFSEANLNAKALLDDTVIDIESEALFKGLGFDLNRVSSEFVSDIAWAIAYQEQISGPEGTLNVAKFLTEHRTRILDRSDISFHRDNFEGINVALASQSGLIKYTNYNPENNSFFTPFHNFNSVTKDFSKSPPFNAILNSLGEAFEAQKGVDMSDLKSDPIESLAKARLKSLADSASSSINGSGVNGPHIGEYQRYLLMLKELVKDENDIMFEQYVQQILSSSGYEDASTLNVEQLLALDFSPKLVSDRLSVISTHLPALRKKVDDYINEFDASEPLSEAGYDVVNLPQHFIEDVQTTMAFEASFPDPSKAKLSDRLKSVKNSVMRVLAKDSTRLALSGAMTVVACTLAGPVGVALSGANLASNLIKNQQVVDTLNKGHSKFNSVLIRLGLKKEVVTEKEKLLGDKIKSFTNNKWVKNGLKVAGVGALVFGVGAVSLPIIEATDFAALAQDIGNSVSDGASQIADVTIKGSESALDALDAISDYSQELYVSASGGVSEYAENASNYASDAMNDFESNLESISLLGIENASELSENIINPAEKLTSEVAGLFSEFDKFTDLSSGKVDSSVAGTYFNNDIQDLSPSDSTNESNTSESNPSVVDRIKSMFDNFTNLSESANLPQDAAMSDVQEAVSSTQVDKATVGGSEVQVPPTVNNVTVQHGDTTWALAKEQLHSHIGSTPTNLQISALINSLDIADKNFIIPGDSIPFPSDLSEFENIHSVEHQSWMDNSIEPNENLNVEVAETLDIDPLSRISDAFDITAIIEKQGVSLTLSEVASLNPDINLHNLTPGDVISLSTDSNLEYAVPEVNDVILSSVFPDGLPTYLDEDKYIESFGILNPDLDLSSGLFGNDSIGNDLVNATDVNFPNVSPESLEITDRKFILEASASHGREDIYDTLLKAAYPDGVPELVDEKAVLADIKSNNPELRSAINRGHSFSVEINLESASSVEAIAQTDVVLSDVAKTEVSQTPFEKGNQKSFIDRIKGDLDTSSDLTF